MKGTGRTRSEALTKLELAIEIEELEAKIAPDGGETVLPLPTIVRHR